jgi:hypothetical protein
MTMQFDHYEYTVGTHFLSALINGDESGLTDEESARFAEWVSYQHDSARAAGFTRAMHWAVVGDSRNDFGFCEVRNTHGEVETVRLMVEVVA